jgi:hypothetical protein
VRILLAIVAAGASALFAQAERPAESNRVDRLELLTAWLDAVDRHQPAVADASVERVAAWSARELRLLREHVPSIVSLIRDPDLVLFFHGAPGSRRGRQILYSPAELTQLRRLAGAHGVVAAADRCPGEGAGAGPGRNGANPLLKRAAMLHLDAAVAIATGVPQSAGTQPSEPPHREAPFMVKVDDGRPLGLVGAAGHLEMGRELLERVAEPCATRPDPARDAWVRHWYTASLAHQLSQQRFEVLHVLRAVELFRDDAEILALAGATHETLSTPLMQGGVGDDRDLRDRLQLRTASGELSRAEDLLRRALRLNERHVEARLRLGNVLGLRGKHAEAVRELGRAVSDAGGNRILAYYARMLHGRELEASGDQREARIAYEQASRLVAEAHAPRLALSQLLKASGDAAAATELLERLVDGQATEDPWWEYYAAAGRSEQRLLRELGAATPQVVSP